MSTKNKELEVKYYISDLGELENHLKSMGASRLQPRTYEYNLRFDTPGGDLAQKYQILRLRKDTANRLTFKGAGTLVDGVRCRKEIEFMVSDFEDAKDLLESLGYRVNMIYEKYRTVYRFEPVLVTLDEMPFGNFIEIEGPEGASIKEVSLKLGLKWNTRILDSYAILFQLACDKLGLRFNDLTFSNFENIQVHPDQIGLFPADG
jgi:adenylate cyclase class 2